jgi:hypothetical protein
MDASFFQDPTIRDFIARDIQQAGDEATMVKSAGFLGPALMVGGLGGLLYAGAKGLKGVRKASPPGQRWRQLRRRALVTGHPRAGRPPTPKADPTLSPRRI